MKTNIKNKIIVALIAVTLLLVCSLLLVGCNDNPSNNEQDKVVTGITLDMRNAQTDFFVGDTFSTLGLGIVVHYEDGSSSLKLASGDDVDVLAPDLSAIGTKDVYVSYGGFTTNYSVNVSRVDGIALDISNVKRGYVVGDEMSIDGLSVSVKITTLNSLGNEVTSLQKLSVLDYTVETPTFTDSGLKTVTVSYQDYTETFDVYVTPSVTADSILKFEGDGSLTLYITNRAGGGSSDVDASAEGWYLLVSSNGAFDMYEASMRYVASSKSYVFDSEVTTVLSADGKSVVATINGKDYTLDAAIYRTMVLGWDKQIVEIRIDAPSTSKEYVVGGTFTYDGLKAIAVYSDGSVEELEGGSFAVEAPSLDSMNQIGVKTVNGVYTAEDETEMPFSYQIYCIPDVPWETNKLDFGYDQNGSGATLELFVTERSARHEDGAYWGSSDQTSKGWLLVKHTDGSYEMYQYEFYLAWDVSSHPYPNGTPEGVSPDGVSSRVPAGGQQYGDNLVIEINGMTFVAFDNNLWHLIVIGWQ